MASLFQNVKADAFRQGITPRTRAATAWFRKKAQTLRPARRELLQDDEVRLRNRTAIGKMYMYFYDPKTKDTLPYYDRFPLTIIVDPAPNGFYGLNLHYLPVPLRARLLDGLMGTLNNEKYDETTRFRLSYSMLSSASKLTAFKPCFKRYLSGHVRSRFALVDPSDWEIATFLPTADFAKASISRVYRDSRRIIRG